MKIMNVMNIMNIMNIMSIMMQDIEMGLHGRFTLTSKVRRFFTNGQDWRI